MSGSGAMNFKRQKIRAGHRSDGDKRIGVGAMINTKGLYIKGQGSNQPP